MTAFLRTSRRAFIKTSAAVGGGLSFGFFLPTAQAEGAAAAGAPTGNEVNAWVVVQPDETIVIRYARSEMGQGSMTSAPMLVAEELDCDWRRVKVEYAAANQNLRRNRVWGDMATVGSRTIRQSQDYLRKAGAGAREMLVAAAAQQWKVPAAECTTSLGTITHAPSGRSTTFGKVATAASKLEAPKEPKLKDPKDWKLVGTSVRRVDIPATAMGAQRYGIDVQLPGMRYAAIAQCPVFGGKVKSFDAARIQGRRGILKVQAFDEFVAVIADNWWRAKEALKELPIEWDFGANVGMSSASILDNLRAGIAATDAVVARREGDAEQAFAKAAKGKLIEAEYFTPYLAHATLEPQVCTAVLKNGKLEVWTSTQSADSSLTAAATAAGIAPENVELHAMQVGGGFGRRGASQDFVRFGVQVAKAMEGTPVKTLWTREEDTQHDFYRPISLIKLRAALDAGSGQPVALQARVSAPSIMATLLKVQLRNGVDPQALAAIVDMPHKIPNLQIEYSKRDLNVPIGFWRTVGHSQNPFVRECFIDELAHAAGADPVAYRRTLLAGAPKDLAILEAVVKAADWGKPLPVGVFRGVAETEGYGSYTAVVAELSVSPQGEVAIQRLVLGIDCGHAVNPDNISAQMQGSAVFALTAMFMGEVTLKDGRVEQSNFHDYPMLRLSQLPKVEVVLAPTGGFWGGVGEPGQASIVPAVCNAIFAATGKRIRALPLKSQGLSLKA
jgi:isoquinoline 1-oxidoreductase beta subunit